MGRTRVFLVLGLFLALSLSACSTPRGGGGPGIPYQGGGRQNDVVVNVVSPKKRMVEMRSIDLAAFLSTKPARGEISSEYGMRKLAKNKKARQHNGIDVKAGRGTPVLASGEGTVTFAGTRSTFGKLVEISHAGGLVTRYAHLDKLSVKKGQTVASGQKIGTVGSTGRSTGPHLHFEVLVNNRHIDPLSVVTWG